MIYVPGPEDDEPKPPNRWAGWFDKAAWGGLILFTALALMMTGDAININSHLNPKARADTPISDKYDGDCTGHETAGRCQDKCPAPSFVRGYDKETGAAICGTVTGCPYGDSIPLGPECDKVGAQQVNQTPQTVDIPASNVNQNCDWGK